MSSGTSAIAVCGDRILMDVVGYVNISTRDTSRKCIRIEHTERTALTRQIPDYDLHVSALATGRAPDLDLAGDAALRCRQDGLVSGARRVVQSGCCISSQRGEWCKSKSQQARWKEVHEHGIDRLTVGILAADVA